MIGHAYTVARALASRRAYVPGASRPSFRQAFRPLAAAREPLEHSRVGRVHGLAVGGVLRLQPLDDLGVRSLEAEPARQREQRGRVVVQTAGCLVPLDPQAALESPQEGVAISQRD